MEGAAGGQGGGQDPHNWFADIFRFFFSQKDLNYIFFSSSFAYSTSGDNCILNLSWTIKQVDN